MNHVLQEDFATIFVNKDEIKKRNVIMRNVKIPSIFI